MDGVSPPTQGLPARPRARRARLSPATRLFGVNYDDYVRLRDDRRNDGLRLTYHDGVLEIMSPEYLHGHGAFRLGLVVILVAEASGLDCTGAGSTTFRRGQPDHPVGKGKEPDQSFYLARESSIRDKESLDLESDPPPDLWIEVDNRVSSKGRFPVYAEFGVPEVWQYRIRRHRLKFFRLNDTQAGYNEIDRSISLPMLTPDLVLFALDQARGRSDSGWMRWLREWAAQLPNP